MMRFDLSSQVAVVTGALGKLGPVWCRALIDAGATVAGIDLSGAVPTPAYADLERAVSPGRLHLFQANVLDRPALERARDAIVARLGVPSVLVNNAGIDQPPGQVASYRVEEFPADIAERVLAVNVLGAFQVAQVFGAEMVRAGRGSIINIGSLYAAVSPDVKMYDHIEVDPPFLKPPMYGASKAALVNLTKYLATHWAPYGVRVNALSPGGVLGGQDEEFKRKFNGRVPMGRMAVDEDLAGPLVFLASEASSYVTGIELRVDGGFTAW
jgi:NAD(P)-dependent dehydrogenase (short-subunit alcohol dehydrogenase family)